MMNTDNNIQWFERYLDNSLNAEEVKLFEKRLQEDDAFAHEFEAHVKTINALNIYARRTRIKDRLNTIHNELLNDSKYIKSSTYKLKPQANEYLKPLIAAASLALVISIGTYLAFNIAGIVPTSEKNHYIKLSKDLNDIRNTQYKLQNQIEAVNKKKHPASLCGSGVVISSKGYIITSEHLVKDADSVFIENARFKRLKCAKIYTDPKLDIAILKVEDSSFSGFGILPYTLRPHQMYMGESVYTFGYPKQDIVYGEGYISSVNGYEGDTTSYQVSVPVNPGNSGSPLFDKDGYLAGIIQGKHSENEASAFAFKSYYLKKIINENDSLRAKIKLPQKNYLKYQQKLKQINQLQDYVFLISSY
ncbi:MAG: serine protease [Cytophagaceae bacterium]|nr:serine protease [Cytophagaceae bacterium]MDW8456336.1 serine protease [Cytophagaceae bacterium]